MCQAVVLTQTSSRMDSATLPQQELPLSLPSRPVHSENPTVNPTPDSSSSQRLLHLHPMHKSYQRYLSWLRVSSSGVLVALHPITIPRHKMRRMRTPSGAYSHPTIPPWLDPLDVDADDPTKLPLCWYGVPFHSGLVFAYAWRTGVAVYSYMTRRILRLKPEDFSAYRTWPKLVEWLERKSGLKMHVKSMWGSPTPIFTFGASHEMSSITTKKWSQVLGTYQTLWSILWRLS